MDAETGWPLKVEVEWVDPATRPGWYEAERVLSLGPALCRALGYIVGIGAQGIVLSMGTDHGASQRNTILTIPLGVVVKVWTIPDSSRALTTVQELLERDAGHDKNPGE